MASFLAPNLRYLRRQANLSQSDAADQLGTDYNTISRYENGKAVPRLDMLSKLANLYQVSLAALSEQDLGQEPTPELRSLPAAGSAPVSKPLLVTVELDGTTTGLARVIARLRAINEVVAETA